MTLTGAFLASLLAMQAAPAAPVVPPAPATTAGLPAALTCIYDELPRNRPMLSLDEDGAMRRLAPIIFPADQRCVARHSMDEAARSRALRYAFNRHQIDVFEIELDRSRLPLATMRRYFATMDAGQIDRIRTRTATVADAEHMYAFLERDGVFRRLRGDRERAGQLGTLTGTVVVLLVEEADLIAGRE
jgi:hypothetical protein